MFKIAGSMVGLLALPTIAVAQQLSPAMIIGWLGYSVGTISQDLSVQNNSWSPIKAAKIGCRFFDNSKQLGAGTVEIKNIAANAAGYKTMTVASRISPNNATCKMVSLTY
jgi:hypothetical protein